MSARVLMVQGTTSDAGKSALVTGLGRWLQRRGVRVAPFKPQNMALNSAVTADGGEIGRAQALQATACGIPAHVDMNPVLLKPNSDRGAQVIIQGHAVGNMEALEYTAYKQQARHAVLESFARLQQQYEVVLVEGAGSPAEINLRANDIANMGFAEAVDCPVVLIADIDRGGVFAHIVGTLSLLSESEQQRIAGVVINRFRGDKALLDPGLEWLQQHSGKPVVGVLPYLHGLHLEAEDSLNADSTTAVDTEVLKVIVPALPRISNHTDFDPLRLHPQVEFEYVGPEQPIPPADLIILPGSKSVRADRDWLRQQGWDDAIHKHLRYGGKLLGICGGYQMLGQQLHDPEGIESVPGSSAGLNLLALETTLAASKQLRNVNGILSGYNTPVQGYEIHAGVTRGLSLKQPAIRLDDGRDDGALSDDQQIMGTYLHGLFEAGDSCRALLEWAGLQDARAIDYAALRERGIDQMADAIEQHCDSDWLQAQLLMPAAAGAMS